MSSPARHGSPPRHGASTNFSTSGMRRGEAGSLVVDDLLQGMNEWRNIQDVIRSTFKALHDVIKAQGDAVKSLERQLESKASSEYVQGCLLRKANISDVNRSLTDITHALEGKASIYDLEQKPDRSEVQLALKGKASITEVTAGLSDKADREDLELLRQQFERHVAMITSQVGETKEHLDRKVDLAPFEEKLKATPTQTSVAQLLANKVDQQELQALQSTVSALQQAQEEAKRQQAEEAKQLSAKVETFQRESKQSNQGVAEAQDDLSAKLESLVGEMAQLMTEHQQTQSKSHRDMSQLMGSNKEELVSNLRRMKGELREEVESVSARVDVEVGEVRKQVERVLNTSLHQVEELLGQTARRDDVVKALAAKADKGDAEESVEELKTTLARKMQQLQAQLEAKADKAQLDARPGYDALEETFSLQEQALQRTAEMIATVQKEMEKEVRRLKAELENKAEKPHVNGQLEMCFSQLAATEKEIRKKADMKDVNTVVDGKADVDEVNKALLEVNSQLSSKASLTDISATLQEQALLNSTLISELCLGRWIWKSLKTKSGGAVPWNIQTANSDPGNLLWEKDKTFVTCVTPGLYEVTLGFFSRRKPVVKLHVNGESVLTVAASPQSVVHHAGGRLQSSGRYTNSNITGLTHVDFIALPARARVSMSYAGDDDAEAFMGLRKL